VRRVVEGSEQGRAMGRAGRVRIAEGFDVEHHVEAVLALYRRAIDETGTRGA